jgi:tetratricopeptide (TPR) repeat protein
MCETDATAEKTTMETDVDSAKKEESEKPADETPAPTTTEGEGEEVEKKTDEEVKKTEDEVDDAAVEGEDEAGESDVEGEDVDEEDLTKNEDAKAADETEAEDISNLQRAWEMFELAKLVFGKNFDNDLVFKSKRIAECLIKLGEISIEQELYDQALIDIKESIRMQEEKEAVERDERMLAESYYQFGLAHQFSEQFQVAGEQYQKSINILQIRIDKLKGMIEQSSDDFEKATFNDEITELEAILPEMVSKLEEIKEQGEQSLKLIKEAKECFMNKIDDESGVAAVAAVTAVVTEVKDITSLVKSKRKISSSAIADTSDETAIKKTRVESDETIENAVVATVNEIPIETDQVAAVPVENVSAE